MENYILHEFGKTIKSLRNSLELSQEDFADKCGFHRTYIGQIERGERNPSLKSIEVFAKTLKMSLSQLFAKCEQLKNSTKKAIRKISPRSILLTSTYLYLLYNFLLSNA